MKALITTAFIVGVAFAGWKLLGTGAPVSGHAASDHGSASQTHSQAASSRPKPVLATVEVATESARPSTPAFAALTPQPANPHRDPLDTAADSRLVGERIQLALDFLASDPQSGSEHLYELLDFLARNRSVDATAEIIAFLDSGEDAQTGLAFTIAESGELMQAPTLRVALLDELGRGDAVAAAAYAQTVLDDLLSAEESAVALRNYAWGTPDSADDPYLAERTRAVLNQASWSKSPSPAYLESFDFVVYTRDVDFLPHLVSRVTEPERNEIKWAAFLALDRLVQAQPRATLAHLLEDVPSLDAEPLVRAGLFARAPANDPSSLDLVEAYLAHPGIDSRENEAFLNLYPLQSQFVAPKLATRDPGVDIEAQAKQVQAALAAVNLWLEDHRFAEIRAPLQIAKSRLTELVEAAIEGGVL